MFRDLESRLVVLDHVAAPGRECAVSIRLKLFLQKQKRRRPEGRRRFV